MREEVVFKGSRSGLELVLSESADFNVILEQLRRKLKSAAKFFTNGTIVKIPTTNRIITPEQQQQLTILFADYGLNWQEVSMSEQDTIKDNPEVTPVEIIEPLIVNRTLRGGQELVHSTTVIIHGDVNPGAKVVAGGDIIIYGVCRGIAHAGAYGNEQASITADSLLATQLRIAGLIARAPDNLDKPQYPETARIREGAVVIEPANK